MRRYSPRPRRLAGLAALAGLLMSLLVAAGMAGSAPVVIPVSQFGEQGKQGWGTRSFTGSTQYKVVETDAGPALHARAQASASALYRGVDVDLDRTPCLSWRWRIESIYPDNDAEQRKAGDDYPARVYVIFDTGIGWWNRRAVNYVWSSYKEIGSTWPNAYTARAHMIAVSSGPPGTSGWRHLSRNVAADYERVFGEAPPELEAVAVMTDSDDQGGIGEAWYQAIRFHEGRAGQCRPEATPTDGQ